MMARKKYFLYIIHFLLPVYCVTILLGTTTLLTVDGLVHMEKCIGCSSRNAEVFAMLQRFSNRIYWRLPVRKCNCVSALGNIVPTDAELEPARKISKTRDGSTAFAANNVYVEHFPVPHGVWSRLVPPLQLLSSNKNKNRNRCGIDVAVTFSKVEEGARDLLECINFSSLADETKKQQAFHHLVLLFTAFQEIFEQGSTCNTTTPLLSLYSNKSKRTNTIQYQARLVASRGSSGSKCSRFHVDHVPIRLICALEGPGVVYIDDCFKSTAKEVKTAQRNHRHHWREEGLVNASDETDTKIFNNKILQLLDEESIPIRHAKTGDAIIMMGKKWEKRHQSQHNVQTSKSNAVGAVVHRSPNLSHFQGRVLLTVDVFEPPDQDD